MIIDESVIPHAANPGPIERSTLLFLEADQLYEQAYALLKEPVSTQSLGEFSAAKKRADEKYRQARQEWLNARPRINR